MASSLLTRPCMRGSPKLHHDESRTQGLDRLEVIRFLQVARTITVHHGALAYLLGINALRASEAATVRIEDYRETFEGTGYCIWLGRATNPPPCPSRCRCSAFSKPVAVTATPDD